MGSAIRELHISVARRPSNDGIQNGSYVFFLLGICCGRIRLLLHGGILAPFRRGQRSQLSGTEVVIPENGGVGGPPLKPRQPASVPLFPNLKSWVQA